MLQYTPSMAGITLATSLRLPGGTSSNASSVVAAVAAPVMKAVQSTATAILQTLERYPNAIQAESAAVQISPEDGIWPREKGGLLIINDAHSARKAMEVVVEGFNPQHFSQCLSAIDQSAFYPVVSNPETASYKGKRYYEVSLACDAAYCLLLISLQNLWKVEDLQARKDLVHFNINPLMKRIVPLLGTFLVAQQIGDLRAAPCFNFYKFENEPLKELKELMVQAIDKYAQDPLQQSMLRDIEKMIAECVPVEL